MKRPFKRDITLAPVEIGSFERVYREFGLSNGQQITIEYDIRREPRGGDTIEFYRCFDERTNLPASEMWNIDTLYEFSGMRVASVSKNEIIYVEYIGYEEIWVMKYPNSSPSIRFIDYEFLETLGDAAGTFSDSFGLVLRQILPAKLEMENQVREFLEGHAHEYGLELCGNLDIEPPSGKRGDYRARYNGQEVILEVEKDLQDFISHGHSTDGELGWSEPGSIDVVFAVTDRKNSQQDIDVPVELAGRDFINWLRL